VQCESQSMIATRSRRRNKGPRPMGRRTIAKSFVAIRKGGQGHGSSHQMIYSAILDKGAATMVHSKESPKLRESLFPLSTHQYNNGRTARRVLRPSVTMVMLQQNPEESATGTRGGEEHLDNLRIGACERGQGCRGHRPLPAHSG
jgi:hypothetical protein